MAKQHDQAKRWRPRFSVRTLAIFVTLVCVFFGCWEATKEWGVRDVLRFQHGGQVGNGKAVAPPVVASQQELMAVNRGEAGWVHVSTCYYHFWFFGYVSRLPYEQRVMTSVPIY
jgi:hypothetical protein